MLDQPTGADALVAARSFGYWAVTEWWNALVEIFDDKHLVRRPLEPFAILRLPQNALDAAKRLGRAAAQAAPDVAAYRIGLAYTGMLPPEYRAKHGIYYTPAAIAARLMARASAAGVDWKTARVLDPACGGGAFLTPVAQRMVAVLRGCSPRILVQSISARLRGYELDPFAAWLSQVSLDAALLPLTRAAKCRLPALVTVCDTLCQEAPRDLFDLVIGNPPYGRVSLTPHDRARFRRSLYGHANQYGLFTDIALRHARIGGVIAYVTPTSFLAGEYFKSLRALLGREAPPFTVDFVARRKGIFDSVLQETLLATYKRAAAPRAITVHEILPGERSMITIRRTGLIGLPSDPAQPWLLPRSPQQAHLISRLSRMSHRLTDWGYEVSTGPLVWNRYKDQLCQLPGRNRYPLIWAEAVTSEGCFVYRAKKRNHAPCFEIRSGDEWLMVTKPCVLVQRTTAKEQVRRLIAGALPSDFLAYHGAVVIENHLNMVRATVDVPAVSADALAAFLNSNAADQAFRCLSGSVAVSAYELESLPLPAPEEMQELNRLVNHRACRSSIEAVCTRILAG